MIEVMVDSIRISLVSQHRIVVLRETDSERQLPIWIGPYEADAITLELQDMEVARPVTHDLLRTCIEEMGGKPTRKLADNGYEVVRPGGNVKHEVGGARMGDNPSDSVCNKWNQAWDVKNLFLADAAPFVSNADKNPTLTIMALAWRCADRIIEESAKGNL